MVWLLSRYSDSYASNQCRALQQFFKWWADEEELPDPMARLRPPKVTGKLIPVFTSVELSKLERACQGPSRRTALVGNPWSGGWALAFAQRYPQRVSRLVLVDSSGLNVPDIWAWRVFKIPVLGELLANFDVTLGSVHGFLDLAMYHQRLVTAQMVNEFWAPATYRVNRLAAVLLERSWIGPRLRPGSARPPPRP